jgi:hypothetical protein
MTKEFKIKGSSYLIEKGIPPKLTGWKGLSLGMRKGDSVLVKNATEAKVLKAALHNNWKDKNVKVKTRARIWNDGPEYRVWLLEMNNSQSYLAAYKEVTK